MYKHTGIIIQPQAVRPKYGWLAAITNQTIRILFVICGIGLLLNSILFHVKYVSVCCLIFGFGFGYLFAVSPFFQKDTNYKISKSDLFDSHIIHYMDKEVCVNCKSTEIFQWMDEQDTISCIQYKSGQFMSNFTKYKIVNYLTRWLITQKLM